MIMWSSAFPLTPLRSMSEPAFVMRICKWARGARLLTSFALLIHTAFSGGKQWLIQ
jgi:hypothetical protein